ncbi:hypothetical protein ASF43_05700 [Pseudorhodoferax sp. Leaf267]|nr:hypothetical protein ASF43_05700 [Pseudorhodoferax sp. Leaf267]
MSATDAAARLVEPIRFPDTGFLRLKQLLLFIPMSRATVWRRVKDGQFPKPVKLAGAITAWRAEDIRRWMQECP